jgi:hypothetical protein
MTVGGISGIAIVTETLGEGLEELEGWYHSLDWVWMRRSQTLGLDAVRICFNIRPSLLKDRAQMEQTYRSLERVQVIVPMDLVIKRQRRVL